MRPISLRLSLLLGLALPSAVGCKKPVPAPQAEAKAVAKSASPAPTTATPVPATAEPSETARQAEFERTLQLALKDLHFDYDHAEIKEDDKATLQGIASLLRAHGEVRLEIEGHCDERGTVEYNLALGNRRAAGVLHYLTALGAKGQAFTLISYGKERPLVKGHDEQSFWQNRRVHFVLNH